MEFASAYGNDMWIVRGPGSATRISSDGIAWTSIINGGHGFNDILYAKGIFVAGGEELYTSVDGLNWTYAWNGGCSALSQSDTMIVSVSLNGNSYSTNGTTWTAAASGSGMRAVAYGNGRFIGPRRSQTGGIQISTNVIVWETKTIPLTLEQFGVAFGSDQFVVAGRNGGIFTSPNGETWTPRNSGVTNQISFVSFANDRFIATGTNGLLLTSTNGSDWNHHIIDATNSLTRATYGHGRYVVVGDNGTVLSSTNGSNWEFLGNFSLESLNAVIPLQDRFMAVGSYGRALTSAYFGPSQFLNVHRSQNNLDLTVRGQIGAYFRVQAIPNFGNFTFIR